MEIPATADGAGHCVALTFDDGPNPGTTDELLDLLEDLDIRATFCVVGSQVATDAGAALLRRMAHDGHAIANHSNNFDDLGELPEAEIRQRLVDTNTVIRAALDDPDFSVTRFRAPNGSWGPDLRVARVAESLGMRPLGLGDVIHDWKDEWQVVDQLERNLRAAFQPQAVILAHDGGGMRDATVEACVRVLSDCVNDWTFTFPK